MSWFKISDGMPFHQKVLRAGNEAVGAWVRAGAWCSAPDNLTDGYVPPEVAASIAPPKVWARLRAAGLTEASSDGRPGEQIHDFLAYNPSASAAQSRREARANAGRTGGIRSGQSRSKPEASVEAIASGVASTETNPARAIPVPSRPVPIPEDPDPPLGPPRGAKAPGAAKPRRTPEHPLPPDWQAPDGVYQAGADIGLDRRTVDAELAKFRDHAAAHARRCADWTAAARGWLRKAVEMRPEIATKPAAKAREPTRQEVLDMERDGERCGMSPAEAPSPPMPAGRYLYPPKVMPPAEGPPGGPTEPPRRADVVGLLGGRR